MKRNSETTSWEQQFQDLFDKAKEIYPNIDEAILTSTNITAESIDLDNYLNLTTMLGNQISNNQIVAY